VDPRHHRDAAVSQALTTARVVERASGRFGISRALDPVLKKRLLETGRAIELPVLRGRTIVPDTWNDPVVFGHPNHFGAFELPRERRGDIRLLGTWSALSEVPPGDVPVVVEEAMSAGRAVEALGTARLVAKRLRQLPGIHLALRPRSPVVIVLSPRRIRLVRPPVAGLSSLGDDFPEYPGGYRIEIPADVTGPEVLRYAADLEQRLAGEA